MELNLYLVRNVLDGTMYVGKTVHTIRQRWWKHLSLARTGSNLHLHRAIRKYGAENFVVDPLVIDQDFTDDQSLNDGERLMIRLLRINCRLYNITDGGDGVSGHTHSEETRRKISEVQTGRILSEEHRRKISAFQKSKILSDETRCKISVAAKNRTEEHRRKLGAANRGKVMSEEARRKMSKARSTPESSYTRWHVNRGIVNPTCSLCQITGG